MPDDSIPRDYPAISLSSVIDNQVAHVQPADAEFVDLDDAKASAPDRQLANGQTAQGDCANRERADREGSDREAADTVGARRRRADRNRPGARRWEAWLHVRQGRTTAHFAHASFVRVHVLSGS